MNVRELRELLEDYPDDTLVLIADYADDEWADAGLYYHDVHSFMTRYDLASSTSYGWTSYAEQSNGWPAYKPLPLVVVLS